MAEHHLIDVHVLLVENGNILLTRRRDTNPAFDGQWHLPSGKLDADESVLDAAAREAEEEVGVLIDPGDLRHVHTLHVNGSGPQPRLGLFFEAGRWNGEPRNCEPHKCSTLRWFPLDSLPDQLIDYPPPVFGPTATVRPSASEVGTHAQPLCAARSVVLRGVAITIDADSRSRLIDIGHRACRIGDLAIIEFRAPDLMS
jgi:8-oxo-dGTP diphosphatase